MDIKRKIRESYERLYALYAHKFDNLNSVEQFLERYKLSTHVLGEIDHLNGLCLLRTLNQELINVTHQVQMFHW